MVKVLIVDDDPHMRELVTLFLRPEGFEIEEASDGVEALAASSHLKRIWSYWIL